MFGAEVQQHADSPERKRDENFVQDMVLRSVKPLFFEAMKRWIYEGGEVDKLRLLLADLREYESASNDPMRFLSDEVEQLLDLPGDTPEMKREKALTLDPPEMVHIERIPWLANELYTVTEVNQNAVRNAVKRKHWELYAELWPENQGAAAAPPEAGAAAPEATAAAPEAPSITALEGGDVSSAEGIVFQNYLSRGFELESERAEARASFSAVTQGATP